MKKTYLIVTVFICSLFTFIVGQDNQTIEDRKAIQASMKARYATLKKLKAKGIIGENLKGYVEIINSDKNTEKETKTVVNNENSDRKKLYKLIAEKNKTAAKDVAINNAIRIFKKADDNEYFKNKKGAWVLKKEIPVK